MVSIQVIQKSKQNFIVVAGFERDIISASMKVVCYKRKAEGVKLGWRALNVQTLSLDLLALKSNRYL